MLSNLWGYSVTNKITSAKEMGVASFTMAFGEKKKHTHKRTQFCQIMKSQHEMPAKKTDEKT